MSRTRKGCKFIDYYSNGHRACKYYAPCGSVSKRRTNRCERRKMRQAETIATITLKHGV